jgi:MYXO-CTERM domain-containing protein
MGVAASDSKIIGVVGSGGNVWLSKDGGQSWANVATGKLTDPMALPNSDRSLSSIHFDVSNPNTVYVTSVAPEASVNHVWKSTDFGAHWASIDGNGLPAGVPINVIKSDPVPGAMPGKVLYAGTHMGVYRSQDGGATWARFGAGMPLVSVTDLYVSPDESIVRAATFGRGFWELQAVANDFSINANPTSVTITPGASGTSTISTAVTAGKAETIAFSIGGLPTGVTAAFSPTSAMAGASSTLTLTAGANAAPGTYPLTITGTSPSIAHTVGLSLVISGTGDFTIAVAPATLALDPGSNGTATVSTTIASGSAQAITLSISGLPDGVTAMFDNPNIQAGGSATLTVAAASTAAAGTATVTITGTGPSTTHAATLALTINPGMNGSGSGTGSGSGSGSGSGNGAEGNHGGCCSAGGSREAAGNLALALAVVAIGATRRRRRR